MFGSSKYHRSLSPQAHAKGAARNQRRVTVTPPLHADDTGPGGGGGDDGGGGGGGGGGESQVAAAARTMGALTPQQPLLGCPLVTLELTYPAVLQAILTSGRFFQVGTRPSQWAYRANSERARWRALELSSREAEDSIAEGSGLISAGIALMDVFFPAKRQQRAIQYIGFDHTGLHFDSDRDQDWSHTLMLQVGGTFNLVETGGAQLV